MHIGFLTPEFPDISSSGGLGTSIKNLSDALVNHGIKVSVFVYSQRENKSYEMDGITFHLLKHIKYKTLGWYFYRKKIQRYLNRIVSRENIDIIEAPDWTGITAFMKLNCPIIIRLNGSDGYFCYLEGRKQKFKNRLFEKIALKSADKIIAVSAFTGETTKKIFNIKSTIPVISNSIDVKSFSPSKRKIIKCQILYFGSLIRKKGVLELANIFNEVIKQKPETKLLLLGKDVIDSFEKVSTYKLFFHRLNSEARKQVEYLPAVDYKHVKKYIETTEIIILPSFAEALPMTWIEAMALEKPMVTSNIGWAKEVMITGKTGLTENPVNHTAYAEKIIKLLNNPVDAIEMGKAARERVVSEFSTEIIVKKNIQLYEDVLNYNNPSSLIE